MNHNTRFDGIPQYESQTKAVGIIVYVRLCLVNTDSFQPFGQLSVVDIPSFKFSFQGALYAILHSLSGVAAPSPRQGFRAFGQGGGAFPAPGDRLIPRAAIH